MSKYGIKVDRAAREKAVRACGETFRASEYMDNAAKVTMLALALQQAFDDMVLLKALVHLDPSIYDRGTATESRPAANVVPISRLLEPQGETQIP